MEWVVAVKLMDLMPPELAKPSISNLPEPEPNEVWWAYNDPWVKVNKPGGKDKSRPVFIVRAPVDGKVLVRPISSSRPANMERGDVPISRLRYPTDWLSSGLKDSKTGYAFVSPTELPIPLETLERRIGTVTGRMLRDILTPRRVAAWVLKNCKFASLSS